MMESITASSSSERVSKILPHVRRDRPRSRRLDERPPSGLRSRTGLAGSIQIWGYPVTTLPVLMAQTSTS
jgi:hypothetical protein